MALLLNHPGRRRFERSRKWIGLAVALGVSWSSSGVPVMAQQPNPGASSPPPTVREAEDTVPAAKPGTNNQLAGWTLADVEQMAVNSHPSIAELQAKVEAARGRWLQAGLLPNPIVGYSGQQVGSRGLAEQNGVFVQTDFVRGGKLRRGRAVAEQEIARAEMELAAQELRVVTEARLAYIEVLSGMQRVELNKELVRLGGQAVETTEALLKAKEVSRVDVLQARLEVEQSRILLQNAYNRGNAAWRTLSAVIGRPDLPPQQLAGDLNSPRLDYEWESTLQRVLANSPELGAAGAEIERARMSIEKARADSVQNITFQGIVQRDNAIKMPDGAVQVTMPIPVFNRNQGTIREAESSLISASGSYRRLEIDLRNRLALVYERYANSREQVRRFQDDILPGARESLQLTLAAYRAGELGFINLLTAQRTFFQTNLAYLESLRELWLASYEMEGLLVLTSSGQNR